MTDDHGDRVERPVKTLDQYWSVATQVEKYVEGYGSDAARDCRNLGWIALGGSGMATREDVADTLESIGRNAQALAEKVRELDDPREERGTDD